MAFPQREPDALRARAIELRHQLHRLGSRLRRRQPIDLEEFTHRLFYPDLAGGGLSRMLQAELDRIGSEVSWPSELAMSSAASRGQRSVNIGTALYERSFCVDLWAEGVKYFDGWTAELSEVAAASDRWLHDDAPGPEEMAARFSFLDFDARAQAYERGDAIEEAWRGLLEDGPAFETMRPLVEATAVEPSLRQLRPWTSMDRLCFSRWVGFPFSHDLPYAAPRQGRFLVWKPRPGEYLSERPDDLLGEGDPSRAVELLLAALPEPLEVLYRQPASRSEQTDS